MIRVAIVAAAADARARLQSVVNGIWSTVAAVGSIEALLSNSALLATDVVLLHATAETTARELDTLPPLPVVVLIDRAVRPRVVGAMLSAGVRGVLPDDVTSEEMGAAVEAAAAGLVVVPPEFVTELMNTRPEPSEAAGLAAPPAPRPASAPSLTPREREILAMLAEGMPNKLIASRLRISEHTVKTHLEAIFDKLGASTRAEAVARGVRRGLLLL